MSCIDCIDVMEPPPDMILSMPPPPLPSFLLPKSSSLMTGQNETPHQPCFATFMCEPAAQRDQSGIEFIELSHKDDTWLFILVSSIVGVVVLGSILAFMLMKCKKHYYNYYHDTTIKHPPMPALDAATLNGHGSKSATMMRGTMLYPFVPSAHYQSGRGTDNRMLWATLTPHGTRHFVSETFIPQDDHYEIVDYHRQHGIEKQESRKNTLKTSFENSGFVDFDYEDPTPLMESYNTDDIDSGYQEPQNLNGSTYEGSLRGQYVSTPTRIENPNLAPLNLYHQQQQQQPQQLQHGSSRNNLDVVTGTLGSKKATISRRISDLSTRNVKV